ncbi:MAG: hypothetical protein AAF367_03945 [Pseudomonadota bacterium]
MFRLPLIILIMLTLTLIAGSNRTMAAPLRLAAPPELVESGLLGYLLPRFSLKTQVRVTIVGAGEAADIALVGDGPVADGAATLPVIERAGGPVYLAATDAVPSTEVQRLLDWLTSEIGKRTLIAYKVDEVAPFHPPAAPLVVETLAPPSGDMSLGEAVSLAKCGRCHVVGEANKFSGIGSTPSFGALRALENWETAFATFWTLNPHPSFTQIEDVTEPFNPNRPPSIAPVMLTMEEVEGIIAFVTAMEPKDLGPPLAYK